MTTTAMLLLVATITGAEEPLWRIDAGLANGLRVGDSGSVYYELQVGEEVRRVGVGAARVVALDDLSALLEIESERDPRVGFRVGFELPGGRISPSEILSVASTRLDSERFDDLLQRLLEELVPMDAAIEARLARLLAERAAAREPQASPPAAPGGPEPAVLELPAGVYTIGLPLSRARFFNQQPQFEIELAAFEIDRDPVSRQRFRGPATEDDASLAASDPDAPMTRVTFAAAREHCRALGRRLPTEEEWEVARHQAALQSGQGVLEWTSSWYRAYPGNHRLEEEFGERFKVLRGAASHDDPARFQRRFMDPKKSHVDVGFRCATAVETRAD